MNSKFKYCKESIENKKVALYLNSPINSPALELHTAQILDLKSRNNDVHVYYCNRDLESCTINPFKRKLICSYCIYRAKSILDYVGEDAKNLDISKTKQISNEVDDLIQLGVMSSFATSLKVQSKEELNKVWLKAYDNMHSSGRKLFTFMNNEIEKEKFDYVFMFNGRFGCVKPVLEATKDSSAGYGVYDIKKSIHEVTFVNELLHSNKGNVRKAIYGYLKNKNEAKKIAKKFYGKKVINEDTGEPIYTKNQARGTLPSILENNISDKKVITIYPTTDDEYKFIGKEWDGIVPDDQVHEIALLAENLPEDEYIIIVKMHPNQINTPENTLERYLNLQKKNKNLFVEHPNAKSDTYALMHKSDIVITFASTIGPEACYAGKVVILIGTTNYSKLNIGYITYNGKNCAELINKGSLKPKPIKGSIIWGNYLSEYKDNLPAFEKVDNGIFLVNGLKIGNSSFKRLIQLPSKLLDEINKPGFKFDKAFLKKGIWILLNTIKGKWAVK